MAPIPACGTCAWLSLGLVPGCHTGWAQGWALEPLCAAGQPHQQGISKLPRAFKPNFSSRLLQLHQPQQVQKKLQIDVGKHYLQWMKTDQRRYFHKAAGFSCASHQGMCCPLSGILGRTCWKQWAQRPHSYSQSCSWLTCMASGELLQICALVYPLVVAEIVTVSQSGERIS